MASSMEAIQKILQETVAPGISDIKVELAGVKADIRSLQSEIKRLDEKIDNVRTEVQSVKSEVLSEIRHVDQKVDSGLSHIGLHERLAALEARMASR